MLPIHTDTTEKVIIIIVAFLGVCLIVQGVRWLRRARPALNDDWGLEEPAIYDDEDYLAMLHGTRELVPAFTAPRHPAEQVPTSVLRPLPAPLTRTQRIAAALERDDYLTGRAMRILRKEAEMREGWHWDELAGEWRAGRNLIESLPWDDWLRQLLDDDAQVPA